MSNLPTDKQVDTHSPSQMAAWLRERKAACLEFYKLDSEEQQRHFLQRWQQHVLPHLAFRFGQAAELIERLERDRRMTDVLSRELYAVHDTIWTRGHSIREDDAAIIMRAVKALSAGDVPSNPSQWAECHEHAITFPMGAKCPACTLEAGLSGTR